MHKISRANINILIGISLLLLGGGQGLLFGGGQWLLAPGDIVTSASTSTWAYCNIGQADTKLEEDSDSTPYSASLTLAATGTSLASTADAIGFASGPAKLAGDGEIVAQIAKLSGGVIDRAMGAYIRENYGTDRSLFPFPTPVGSASNILSARRRGLQLSRREFVLNAKHLFGSSWFAGEIILRAINRKTAGSGSSSVRWT